MSTRTLRRSHPTRGRSRPGKVLVGCLIVLGIVLLLAVGAGIFVAMNLKNWTADGLAAMTEMALAESSLPQSEQGEVMVEVRRVTDAFKNGDIDLEQFGTVMEAITMSPVLQLGEVMEFQNAYIGANADLTDEEKAAGRAAYDRVMHGVVNEMLNADAFYQSTSAINMPVTQPDGSTSFELKPSGEVTADELRECIAEATRIADEGSVPAEVEAMDLSDELKKVVDEQLGTG